MKAILVLISALFPAVGFAAPIGVSVDVGASVHPFSPLIFGVAYGNAAGNAQIGYSVDRWGGNSTSRYNWQVDVHNTASDYFYENIPDCAAPSCTGTPPVGNSADQFIAAALVGGALPLITIPTIGWTPRSDSPHQHPYFAGFSVAKYGAQQAVDPYDTDAGNGYHGNGTTITGNDASDTSMTATPQFESQWIAHLQSTFGTAAAAGVRLYALDNEVMLWNSTQRDVHPLPPTYDEIWNKTVAYASAIKQQDANALVTGPVTWGYCDLFTSAKDAAAGNCLEGTDRQNHGGLPFVAWYLQQVCSYQQAHGIRLVDYLDLHYYPQGTNVALNDDDSATTAALRLRSLRELYDPTWVSESWIGQYLGDNDANHYNKPNLIPRAHAWIDQYCPGTRLAITEYNWGNDDTTSGAIAQAELLAIFARNGVDLATRWVAPVHPSKAERAFSIFLDYDGAGSRVMGDSVAAVSADLDRIGAYAFHLAGQRTMVLLTNKDTIGHDVVVSFAHAHSAHWKLYGFSGTAALAQTASGSLSATSLTLTNLPGLSASLLVIPDDDAIFVNGFESTQ
ncbi:MAG: glycoside hydrolase family 44 protein [Rudaea sp.]